MVNCGFSSLLSQISKGEFDGYLLVHWVKRPNPLQKIIDMCLKNYVYRFVYNLGTEPFDMLFSTKEGKRLSILKHFNVSQKSVFVCCFQCHASRDVQVLLVNG